ncbi:MAG: mechanosensitive ion channel family protein [Eubacteriaceae bacterium]|nr:mechanosensitive ion channel family protein [Eubacteriaceae bacterium]MDD4507485.1 mechanosensitive ion channel family protein [Eubacteriaceae bacterium]
MEFNNFGDFWHYLIGNIDKINMTEKIISIAVTLIVMFICVKMVNVITNNIFKIREKSSIVETERDYKRNTTFRKAFKTVFKTGIYIAGILVILSFFVNVSALVTVAGVGTVAIGLGAKGMVEDMISGFVIIYESQYLIGDYVTLDGNQYGVVEDIGIRATSIRKLDGSRFIIHNGKIDRLINHSRGHISAGVDIGIAYEENIEKVESLLKQVCDGLYNTNRELYLNPPMVLGVTRFDDSAMNIRVVSDTDPIHKLDAEILMRKRIKEALDKHKIEIPYNKTEIILEQDDRKNRKDPS